jgi:hypothetical protein
MPGPKPRGVLTVIAIVVVIAVAALTIAAFVVAGALARHVHVVERTTASGEKRVDVESPLGDLAFRDDNRGHASIQAPFGGMTFDQNVEVSHLGLEIYPGATMLSENDESAFGDEISVGASHHPKTPRLHMQMKIADGGFTLDLAEFRTADSPNKVLDFYRTRMKRLPGTFTETEKHDATELKVHQDKDNERVVAVKSAGDGTHFVIVHVLGSEGGV